jgi:tetratricopeptide (TPR) repeat protein
MKNVDNLDLDTAVLAWLRVGQIHDCQGQHAEAVEAYGEAVKTAPQSAAAEEAQGYMKKAYRRREAK